MKWPFLLMAMVAAGLAMHGLATGTVIANKNWPNAQRSKQPIYFWSIVVGYTAVAAVMTALAVGLLWP